MIGSAAWRDRRFAAALSKRSRRAAVSVAPLRETPGASAQACATPIASASAAPASECARDAGRRSAAASTRPAAICAEATPRADPSRRSIGRSNSSAAAPGGTNSSACRPSRRASSERTTSATSSRRAIRSASAVPAWSATSNDLRSSSSSSTYDQPRSAGTSTRWPLLEIGRSSAGPCSRPSPTAWPNESACLRRGFRTAPPPAHEPVGDPHHDEGEHHVVDVVQAVLPVGPVVAGLLADEREREHPRDAAEEGEQREAPERHPRDAGRERDEGADDRQHAREEDGGLAVAREPAIGALDVALLHVQLPPVLLEQLDAPVVADRVRDPGSHDVRDHTHEREREER